ncbi:MAG: Lytic transglycosylase catalytic [Cyanobacteria bacterium RYN_339]|nr:Lytic transglycosylase catalytic [Cyanobacteria bacterium RYN_339]
MNISPFAYRAPLRRDTSPAPDGLPAFATIVERLRRSGLTLEHLGAIARRNGLQPSLLLAVIRQESQGVAHAHSPKGAMGLMQLMPATARGLGVHNAYNPIANVEAGARYLGQQLRQFGRADLALAAYNAGPGNVRKHGGVPPFTETRAYVRRILAAEAHAPA